MKNGLPLFAVALILLIAPLAPAAEKVDFAHDVVPILKEHCGKCHTGDKKKGGLSFNTRASLLAGGENGKAAILGKSAASDMIKRMLSKDDLERMPPEGPRVPAEKIATLRRWIDEGLVWEEGFTFGQRVYEPPLKPRRPVLPAAIDGRENPIDRIIDAYLKERKLPRPVEIGDEAFIRRAYMDIIGLLPTPDELAAFKMDTTGDKRAGLVINLLNRKIDYAEHWLTFWNDLLRNDYSGTGFIDGGRRQISKWLYAALVSDMPYDQFTRELIAPPSAESAGFINGIKWRGNVSAGQTVEIQFAQSVGQTLLGINLKCASCHDSFVDRWTLQEAFGMAAIFSNRPLELNRCDKPTGKMAQAAWLFPELGAIDPKAPQPQRLKQLAALFTHPENGRWTRTIVNRIWHRMMGRGVVHPVDAMQTEPWSADLLDYLAVHLADNQYDLKKTIELIATSRAYQSRAQVMSEGVDDKGYVYAGPRARRMTAEQFVDAVWQLTDAGPTRFDAPITRVDPAAGAGSKRPAPTAPSAKWIWSKPDARAIAAGETITLRRTLDLKTAPAKAFAIVACDNAFTLYVNGKRVAAGDNWEQPHNVTLTSHMKTGANEILIVASNGGNGPNPAGLYFEARIFSDQDKFDALISDEAWEWTATQPEKNGEFKAAPKDWRKAAMVGAQGTWAAVDGKLAAGLSGAGKTSNLRVRASLMKSDLLMRSLGRPNREQIVTVRPDELNTLEALDLSNGETLANTLSRGARNLIARDWGSPRDFVRWLYHHALSREPSVDEERVILAALGPKLTEQGIEDVLWSVVMFPEFQLVR